MIMIHRRFENAAFFSFFFLRFFIFLFSSSDGASLSARPVERIDKSHTIRLVPRGILRAVIKAVNYFFLPCAIIHSTLHKGSASERASENETRDRTFRAIYVTKGSPRARTRRIPFSLSPAGPIFGYYFPRWIVRSPVNAHGIIAHDERAPWNTFDKNKDRKIGRRPRNPRAS